MKKLVMVMMLLLASTVYAQGGGGGSDMSKGGGNGQLVVIPTGGRDPVPYEVAKAWDSGVYRNFYKLPGVDGTVERRAKFNKMYGVHALPWLELLKEYSPSIHYKLVAAAKKTTFRILANYIYWEHTPYPEGEVDYKKYEKAALYNGEIILSTLVMDKVGRLENILTKEENQGFIVIHELINAAFRNLSVKDRLELGELIVNIKILNWSKREFLAELIHRFGADRLGAVLTGLEERKDLIEALEELENPFFHGVKIEDLKKFDEIMSKHQDPVEGVYEIALKMEGYASIMDYMSFLLATGNYEPKLFMSDAVFEKMDSRVLDWGQVLRNHFLTSNFRDRLLAFMEMKRISLIYDAYNDLAESFVNDKMASFEEGGLASIYYYANSLKKNFETLALNKNSYTRYGDLNSYDAQLKTDYESRGFQTYLNDLEKKAKAAFVRAKLKLGVKDFYVDGVTDDCGNCGTTADQLRLRKGRKIVFVSNSKKPMCMINKTPFKSNEALIVRGGVKKNGEVKLQKLSGGKRIKINYKLVEHCSVADLF